MRKFWILFFMLTASMDAVAKLNVTQIVTTEYVQSYLRQYADMPELELMGAAPDTLASEEYVLSAIDFVNGDGNLRTHARPNTLAGVSYLPNIADKINTCPIPWTDTPGMVGYSGTEFQWMKLNYPFDIRITGIIYNEQYGTLVARGIINYSKYYMLYSTDGGVTWNQSNWPADIEPRSTVYNEQYGTLVTSGDINNSTYYMMYSADGGKTWNQSNWPSDMYAGVPVYNEQYGTLVAGGHTGNYPNYTQYMMYSTDGGKTWNKATGWSSDANGSFVYMDGLFVALVGREDGTYVFYSEDGIYWQSTSKLPEAMLSSDVTWNVAAFSNGNFVVLSSDMMMLAKASDIAIYSSDMGQTWTQITLPIVGFWMAADDGEGALVAVGPVSGAAIRSTDGGQTWQDLQFPTNVNWDHITYDSGMFIAYAAGKLAYSYNGGNNWTFVDAPSYGSILYSDRYVFNISGMDVNIGIFVTNPWAVGDGCSVTDGVISCDAPLVGGVATCENAVCSCTRQKLINNGEYVDNVAQTPVEINRTFADQNACNLQCADVCADNAVNNTDGAQKDILCGK